MAAPSAARPTCKLPVIRCPSQLPSQSTFVRTPRCLFVMLADQQREHRRQQHEHQRLNQTRPAIPGNRTESAPASRCRGTARHRLEHRFAGEDVAVEPEAQRDRPEQDRDDLQAAGREEHDDQQHPQHARRSRPSARTAPSGTQRAELRSPQTIQQAKKTSAIASVRLTSALAPRKNGSLEHEASAVWCPQPIEPTPGISPTQFAARMKMKIVREEPERPLDQMRADDAFEKAVEAFDEPLEKVLRAVGHLLHAAASRAARRRSSPTATIQVTTIELVIGKPNGRAISTALCDRPCSVVRRRPTQARRCPGRS